MERILKAAYTPEFGAEAVKLVESTGMSVAKAAERLSIPKSSLSNWVRAARAAKLKQVGEHQRALTELEMELASARRELAEVKQERDLLKKVVPGAPPAPRSTHPARTGCPTGRRSGRSAPGWNGRRHSGSRRGAAR